MPRWYRERLRVRGGNSGASWKMKEPVVEELPPAPVGVGKGKGEGEVALAHTLDVLKERESMLVLLREMVEEMGAQTTKDGQGLLSRTRGALASRAPRIRRAVKDSSLDLFQWMRQGGPWRAFFVTVVGLITLIALTGLSVFMIFFIIATANTIVVSFLMSLAAVGAFVATFFTSLTVIYVGAVSIAAVSVSTVTFSTIVAIVLASGGVGVLWLLWQSARKALAMMKRKASK